jgi:hypothetical protein
MTQEYLSRKVVTAWPELRYEGDIPEGAPEGYKGEPVEGYAVKYDTGHISWSPKGPFEACSIPLGNVIHLPAFQVRLLAERAELNDRVVGLGRFLALKKDQSEHQLGMTVAQFELLKKQHGVMVSLLEILDARIEEMSNPAGIAELFKPDPNLVETTQGYVEKIADVKPLGYSDEWLREKLREAQAEPFDHSLLVGQWVADSTEQVLVARMPLANTKYNLFGLLTAQGQMPDYADITDAIGIAGIKQISDPAGNLIGLTDFKYIKCDSLYVEMSAHVTGEGKLMVRVNRQTCVAEIHFDGLTKDLTIALQVDLVNYNRRPGQ